VRLETLLDTNSHRHARRPRQLPRAMELEYGFFAANL
jgi:hypothetical protein